MLNDNGELTDRELILTKIIHHLHSTMILKLGLLRFKAADYEGSVYIGDWEPPQVGDLVLCTSIGQYDQWTIAFLECQISCDTFLLREIGSKALCTYSNVSVVPIRNMEKEALYDGEKRDLLQKVRWAFAKGGEYNYLFGGLDIESYHEATIWIRERYGGLMKPSKPFPVSLHWNKRTTIRAILQKMKEAGYGTREFELAEEKG